MRRSFDVFTFLLISITLIDYANCNALSLNTEESIGQMGYPLEKYKLQTQDRFTLGLERIPHSKRGDPGKVGKPVLLMHGLFLSSNIFSFSNKSLSYALSDAGYDVWLYNSRGIGLSRTYSIYSKLGAQPRMNKMTWDFSFHEMGVYDFPAVVDFVLNKTGHSKLNVVGYSLGATIALVGLSEKPPYNSKIDRLVLMAPTTRMASYGFPANVFNLASPLWKYTMKKQNFFPPFQDPDTAHRFVRWMCTYTIIHPMCLVFINLIQGTILTYNKNNVLGALTDYPQPASKKMLTHYIQLMHSKKFCQYDYGINGNMHYYNMKTPPEYNLSKVTAPVFILHSKNDHFSTKKAWTGWNVLALPLSNVYLPQQDVKWLVTKLPNVKEVYYIDNLNFGHLSFVLHSNMDWIVNNKIKNELSMKL